MKSLAILASFFVSTQIFGQTKDQISEILEPFFNIPDRPLIAMTGSEFLQATDKFSLQEREAAAFQEVIKGNMPSFMRLAKEVTIDFGRKGKVIKAKFWTIPDYLAIGSDTDFIRIPVNLYTARKIADHFGFVLPTTKMVDSIYHQADVKLSPRPMTYGPEMVSNGHFSKHNIRINGQLGGLWNGNQLVAGHKKDVVLTNRLSKQKKRIAIYGWHRTNGNPIQPLSLVHGAYYADYSHGIRLIGGKMLVNGKVMTVKDVLKDRSLAKIINSEGMIKNIDQLLDPARHSS